MIRIVPILMVALATLACAPMGAGRLASIQPETTETTETTEILWDTWGIPHIYAADDLGLFYAFGWAQARSHGDLVLRLMGQARGRGAEYWGEDYLAADRQVHIMGVPDRAAEWYAAQSDDGRRRLDAFARGFNAAAARYTHDLADEVEVVLPIDGRDLLAHQQRVIHISFVAGSSFRASRGWEAQAGSNAWALAPQRAAAGKPMLLINPHLPWRDFYLFYEAHFKTPQIDFTGATLVGFPFLAVGFNDRIAWSHTVNVHDAADLFELTLEGDGYLWDGRTRPFETADKILLVRSTDGSLREEPLTVSHSVHGPVIARIDDKRALALRIAGLDQPAMVDQYLEMASATNLSAFEAAISRLQMPMFTVIYADSDGHILHLSGGRAPRRAPGMWRWDGIVPGNDSATLWTDTHSYAELPRVIDPASGWLQNANDPPWTTTFPTAIRSEDYPSYMSPGAQRMALRPQKSAKLLLADSSISFEEMIAYKHATRSELADRILEELIAAARTDGDLPARQAAEVLSNWDRQTLATSRGAVLFSNWVRAMGSAGEALFLKKWQSDGPLTTPNTLANPAAAVSILSSVSRQLSDNGGLDQAWGEVNRLRVGDHDFPASGGPGSLGVFRVLNFAPDSDGRFRAVQGDSFVAAVELGDPVRARALMSYGNSSQPGSPHLGDQTELLARQQLRPVWRTRSEIEAHLEQHEVLHPSPPH